MIEHIARLEKFSVDANATRDAEAASALIDDVVCFIHGVIDLEKERKRLGKQRDQLVKGIDGLNKKLTNEKFLERAKPDVVERERTRLADLSAQLATVEGNLKELQ